MQPTEEQQVVIASKAHKLRVRARAGTGKTSTLVKYAEARPRRKILLVAFNKAIQAEAEKRFGPNVTARTSHSLAWPKYGSVYKEKLIANVKANQIAEALDLGGGRYQLHQQAALLASQQVAETLVRFFASRDPTIAVHHVQMASNTTRAMPYKPKDIVEMAKAYWTRMMDPSDRAVGMLHDGYLKLYQMSNPRLPFDDILFDESQDANPCTLDIVSSQDAGQVYVGDEYQSIYQFRGAVNAMKMIEADEDYVLTGSFRFGTHVASVANALLYHLRGETTRIRGLGAKDKLSPVNRKKPHAIICRSNASVFDEAVVSMSLGRKIAFVGGPEGYTFDKVLDGYRLMKGEIGAIRDPYIRSFGSFDRLLEFAEATDDPELKSLKRVVNKYSGELPNLTKAVKNSAVEADKANVILMTGHKSKGLEFEEVRLTDDYVDLLTARGALPDPASIRDEDINLLYVAATRAKRVLEVNGSLAAFLKRAADEPKSPISKWMTKELDKAVDAPQLITSSAAIKNLVKNKQTTIKKAVFGGRFDPTAL